MEVSSESSVASNPSAKMSAGPASVKITASFRCGHCGHSVHAPLIEPLSSASCPRCNNKIELTNSLSDDGSLRKCPVCACDELFWRKDFPQRLGVTIVVAGFAISCVTWYFHMLMPTFAVLLITALIDFTLYALMGDVLECYRCHGQFRGCSSGEAHGGFELETHEKHRQIQARKIPQSTPE